MVMMMVMKIMNDDEADGDKQKANNKVLHPLCVHPLLQNTNLQQLHHWYQMEHTPVKNCLHLGICWVGNDILFQLLKAPVVLPELFHHNGKRANGFPVQQHRFVWPTPHVHLPLAPVPNQVEAVLGKSCGHLILNCHLLSWNKLAPAWYYEATILKCCLIGCLLHDVTHTKHELVCDLVMQPLWCVIDIPQSLVCLPLPLLVVLGKGNETLELPQIAIIIVHQSCYAKSIACSSPDCLVLQSEPACCSGRTCSILVLTWNCCIHNILPVEHPE